MERIAMNSLSPKLDRDPPGQDAPAPPGVFVVGMGRSGTSAVTRMITLLGLSHCIDEDLIPAKHYNRLGFFESRTLQVFNHVLLRRWSTQGWRNPRLPENWEQELGVRLLRRPARSIFESVHPDQPWVFKDSSLNFLLPFWMQALGRRPDVVFIYRHPLAVARSLGRDADIDFDHCVRIWHDHNRAALSVLDGLSVLVIDYDTLVSTPRAAATEMADWLRGRGYDVPAGAEETAADSIDAREQHWRADHEQEASLPADCTALMAVLAEHRGAHDTWSQPMTPRPPARAGRRERIELLVERPRWWWWMAELIMPEPIARHARRLAAPQRKRAARAS